VTSLGQKRLTVRVDKQLWESLGVLALENGRSVNREIEWALRRYVETEWPGLRDRAFREREKHDA
jgi:predicted HicB family RNase H-like nuclease